VVFLDEMAYGILNTGGNHKVFRLVLVQHKALHEHVLFDMAPVAQGIDLAHEQVRLQPQADAG
jgi:hypothetical protein